MERKAFGSAYRKLCMKIRRLWLKVRRIQLDFLLERCGMRLVEVNPAFTSVTCLICGDRSKSNRDGERFRCSACDAFPYGNASPFRGGHEDHADANASKNIWTAGQAVLRGTFLAPAGLFLL